MRTFVVSHKTVIERILHVTRDTPQAAEIAASCGPISSILEKEGVELIDTRDRVTATIEGEKLDPYTVVLNLTWPNSTVHHVNATDEDAAVTAAIAEELGVSLEQARAYAAVTVFGYTVFQGKRT